MKKNILILGSKPNPNLPSKIDCVFFVNGSIYAYDKFKNIEKNHIITDHCFSDKEWQSYKNQLKNKIINNLIITTDKNTDIRKIQKKLYLSNYKYNKLIKVNKRKLIANTVGKINLIKFIIKKHDNFLRKIINIIKLLYNKKTNAKYRPSTGVFVCIYVINNYKNFKKIIISGIGIKKGTHAYNKNQIYYENHCYFDKNILKNISKKGNIFTTEKELNKLTKIKYYYN